MSYPKVSILWLNYNSSHILNVIKQSLDSVMDLNYPNFELIVVDNASSDSSYSFIRNYLDKRVSSKCRTKFARLDRNLGYVGGNNLAYSLRDKESKYVVVMNNDFIANPESLKIMVETMESDPTLGALQGKILDMSGKRIDSAGGFIDEFLRIRSPFKTRSPQSLSREIQVSFVEGTFPIYRISAVRKIFSRFLFPPEGFIYFLEDVFVGLKMWMNGDKNLLIPINVGRHFRGGSLKKVESSFLLHYEVRNRTALLLSSNSRVKLFGLVSILNSALKTRSKADDWNIIFGAFVEGFNLGHRILKKYGLINIYTAPLFKCEISSYFLRSLGNFFRLFTK